MRKSVYSLVLMDDVVEAVDRLAYQEGTSRSNMINRILAQYARLATPEERIQDIFSAVNAVLDSQSALQPLLTAGDAVLALRSALQYKYNPSMRYTVELNRNLGEELGVLRVSLRTQSPALTLYLGQFYKLWAQLEAACLPGPAREAQASGARYTRVLRTPETACSAQQLGGAIADYVRLFDACLKQYFSALDDAADASRRVQACYTQHLGALAAQL